jgi:AcrR family transcriptional regulator
MSIGKIPPPRKTAKVNAFARPKPGPGVRRRLDRVQVLEAARVLSDLSGVSALSITALADKLHIQPPSVYAHFAGLPELRRELALWAYRSITAQMNQAAVGLAGTDALLALGHAYLEFIRSSPGLYSAIIPAPDVKDVELWTAGRVWLAPFERVLATLGLTDEDSVHALRGLRSIVHGFGMLETEGSLLAPVDRDISFRRMLETFVEGLEHHRAVVGSGPVSKARMVPDAGKPGVKRLPVATRSKTASER